MGDIVSMIKSKKEYYYCPFCKQFFSEKESVVDVRGNICHKNDRAVSYSVSYALNAFLEPMIRSICDSNYYKNVDTFGTFGIFEDSRKEYWENKHRKLYKG